MTSLQKELFIKSNAKTARVFTSTRLHVRIKEHTKALATLDKNSLLAQHNIYASPKRDRSRRD